MIPRGGDMREAIDEFLRASTEQRLQMARDPAYEGEIRAYLGTEAFNEYRIAAGRLDTAHLAVGAPKNLIFVPGVMGSLLQSRTKGGIWWVDVRTRKHLDDLRLASDGRSDVDPANDIAPTTTDPTYEPFLSAVLARNDFGHELFPYDWRKPLSLSASSLRDLVVRLHRENGGQPVHLVTHSMGGLIVRAALLEHGDQLWPLLGRIVFLGTPHYGTPAIAGYLKNHLWGFELLAVLGLYLSRETFRSLWGVLGMLPAPRRTYPGTRPGDPDPWQPSHSGGQYVHPCANFDLYHADAWDLDLDTQAAAQLQTILDAAAEMHTRLHVGHQALGWGQLDRMLVIAGVGYRTLFRLAYRSGFFGLWQHAVKEQSRVPGDPHREGDGRVPLASAALENVTIRYVRAVHGGLPNVPAVYEDVFRWLNNEPLQLPDTAEGALSGHLAAGAGESESPHLDGSGRAAPFDDDSGLWAVEEPEPDRLRGLEARLEAEQLPEFNLVRIL
jgi:pimeloyl-ACP methyl ester carboxylesterase